jgi:hypothetical protein
MQRLSDSGGGTDPRGGCAEHDGATALEPDSNNVSIFPIPDDYPNPDDPDWFVQES